MKHCRKVSVLRNRGDRRRDDMEKPPVGEGCANRDCKRSRGNGPKKRQTEKSAEEIIKTLASSGRAGLLVCGAAKVRLGDGLHTRIFGGPGRSCGRKCLCVASTSRAGADVVVVVVVIAVVCARIQVSGQRAIAARDRTITSHFREYAFEVRQT